MIKASLSVHIYVCCFMLDDEKRPLYSLRDVYGDVIKLSAVN